MSELDISPDVAIDPTLPVAQDAPAEIIEQEIPEESSTEELQPPKSKGVGRRIDELTANWRAEQRRAERLEAMLEKTLVKPDVRVEPTVVQKAEPKVEQFATYEEYVGALADHKAELKVEAKMAEIESRRRTEEAERQRSERQTSFHQRADEFRLAHPDFDEVAFDQTLPVTEVMAEALNFSEKGPQMLYFLGQNRDEAMRIAQLSLTNPVAAGIEIGRLETRLSLPQPRTTTKAPPPIQPLSAGGGTLSPDPDNMTTDEWMKWRNSQLRK